MTNIILRKLDEACAAHPDKVAFREYGGKSITYSELRRRAYSIAYAILGLAPDDDAPVAVPVGRSADGICGIFGAIAAGRWYVPVDSELPDDRIASLLGVCSPFAVIGDLHTDAVKIPTDGLPDAPDGFVPAGRDADAPMFGIFTSGSTGVPKLVVKSEKAMMSFIGVYAETFSFTDGEVFGNQIPFYFDASTKDIFTTVYTGATCVIIPAQAFSFPVNLIGILNECRVTTIVWVPSALTVAARFNVFSAATPETVKNVLFVGERMPVKYLNAWMAALPGARFVNLYGSTEVAGNSCYYVVDRVFDDGGILPIGRPFEGTGVYILGDDGNECTEGEICISGDGLAIGYYNDPEKTSAVFRTAELRGKTLRICRSGDFGRLGPDGNFVCVSRRDSQIKHMGHRIELGEIEAAAGAVEGVGECCCFYDEEHEKIVLFFSAASDIGRDIRRVLSSKLPKYMIPHKYRYAESLPHNRNGKIDRALLKKSL